MTQFIWETVSDIGLALNSHRGIYVVYVVALLRSSFIGTKLLYGIKNVFQPVQWLKDKK